MFLECVKPARFAEGGKGKVVFLMRFEILSLLSLFDLGMMLFGGVSELGILGGLDFCLGNEYYVR